MLKCVFLARQVVGGNLKTFMEVSATIGADVLEHVRMCVCVVCVCVRACMRACVRACVHACVRACVRACVCVHTYIYDCIHTRSGLCVCM